MGREAHGSRRILGALGALCALAAFGAGAPAASAALPVYQVGADAQPINPCPDGTWPANDTTGADAATCGGGAPVYLGGFGFGGPPAGNPSVPTPLGARPASGYLRSTDPGLGGDADGAHVRAISITDASGHTVLLADIEVQGWFVADKQAGVGLEDIRKRVASDLHLSGQQIFVQSDHTHAGADALGVWGGVPPAFMSYMANQTVKALDNAYRSAAPANLYYGSAPGMDLLHNQYDGDPRNQAMDSDVRVLQARDPNTGANLVTLLNFSAHADYIGSRPYLLSGDWLAGANALLEQRFGGKAVTLVGTLGRTQPGGTLGIPTDSADVPGCADTSTPDGQAFCRVESYGKVVVDRAALALSGGTTPEGQTVDAARPLSGDSQVASHSYLITDPATNALILGMDYAGNPLGVPIYRSLTPPWLTGSTLGTVAATARIGDVLVSSGPGEMYPQIPLAVSHEISDNGTLRSPIRPGGFMTMGLSNDQLGYIIAPLSAYPQPMERSVLSQAVTGDVISGCISSPNTGTCPTPSPVANDNYFFNVSHTMGLRLTCALLRGADDVLYPAGDGGAYRKSDADCGLFANDAALPAGSDLSISDTVPPAPATLP